MKRLLSLLGMLIVALSTFAQTFTVGDLTYYVTSTTDKTVQVSDGKNATGDVVVPETVTYNDVEYSVTEIGYRAFYQNANIESVSMPSVTSIGSEAFYSCSSLGSVRLPSVTSIGGSAFYSCSKMSSLRIGSVEQWCNVTFSDWGSSPSCSASQPVELYIGDSDTPATNFEVPSTVTKIPDYAFYRTKISSVSAPAATSIGAAAFCSCSALTSAHLPAATFIESGAFDGCSKISSLRIGSVEQWCNVSFGNYSASPSYSASKPVDLYIGDSETPVTELFVPSTVTKIPDYAFLQTTITSVSAPAVTSIGSLAFSDCSALTSVHLPAATSIGSSAFSSCSALTSADFPTATSIGSNAFRNCSALTSAHLPAATSIGDWAFDRCSALTSAHLPAATYIGSSPFQNCSALTSAHLPAATSIGSWAFRHCEKLETIFIPVTVSTVGGNIFEGCLSLSDIYYQGKKEDWSAIAGISIIGIPSTAVIHYSTTPVSDIALNTQSQTLKVDETVQLTATVAPEDATNKSIAWTSCNPDVAKVDENGIVTAIAEGTATITATAVVGIGAMASCEITVEGSTPEPPAIDNDYTDITKYENIIFFNEARQWAGKKITMPLMMDNTDEVTAMQFDLVLPEGITLDKTSRGKYALTFNTGAERTDATVHTLSSSLQTDGAIRVLCYSTDKEPFLGNSGALIDFPLTIAETVEPGDYDIVLKNIILTTTDKKEYKTDEVVCKLIVPDYAIGDANTDGQINVTDIVYIADYILGNADPDFNAHAADISEDGEINVTDIVIIADKILELDSSTDAKRAAKSARTKNVINNTQK